MATRAELMTALRNADAAGDTEAARRIAAMVPSEEPTEAPAPPASFGQRIGQGAADLAAGFGKVGAIALSPFDLGYDAIKGQPLGTSNRARRQAIDSFAQEHGANDWTATVNQAAPEVIATAGPMARGAGLASRQFLGDVALQGAYEGTKSLLQGDDPTRAALTGAAGAAGGRMLARGLIGSRSLISDSARRLVDKDVMPTPGQLFDGPVGRGVAMLEDKASSLPGAGEVINHSRRRSLGEFGRAVVNDAVAPLGGKPITAAGAQAIDAAQRRISAAYDDALEGMALQPANVAKAIGDTGRSIQSIALLDDTQAAKLADYVNKRLATFTQQGAQALNGAQAKALDAEMGHLAREFSRSVNPADRPLGEAFYSLQQNWREAMAASATPDKTALLNAANAAHRNLLPIVKASDKAMAQGGVFTPNQLQRSYGPFAQKPGAFANAAQDVLPSRVPDSGSAGRLLLAGAVGAGALYTAPVAAGLAAIAYSRPAMSVFLDGMGAWIPQHLRSRLLSMAPDEAVQVMRTVAEKNPGFASHLAAQLGRVAAMQPTEEAEQ